jgi:sulfatase maturation enzyme AslB (radical SAM superfamily)
MGMATFPQIELKALDTVWFQISGTLCNLRCHHCFISCAPDNHTLEFMRFTEFQTHLQEAEQMGVKEYYFTGGEPFINPDIFEILEATLRVGPATVLTNATRFTAENVARLKELNENSIYSLEIRVSLDGFSAETNDPIRGAGTFEKIMEGLRLLVGARFLPIVTAMRSWPIFQDETILGGFRSRLKEIGYAHPRIKLLPSLKMGQEAMRDRGYREFEFVTPEMMAEYDVTQLLCHNSRIVSTKGVHVCPILVDNPDALLASRLSGARIPYPLRHQACSTCYQYGALCSNAPSGSVEETRLKAKTAG